VATETNFNNINAFKVWNFKLASNPENLIVDSLALLIGDYEIHRKKAALLILKTFIRDSFLKQLLSDDALYPFDRNDHRVRNWVKQVLSRGKCETCGSKERLEAHHIIRWADYPQGRIDPKNGMCLCAECHAKEHEHDGVIHLMRGRIA
jgi:5-methylcytosine-specific restriction endonuclease McrA